MARNQFLALVFLRLLLWLGGGSFASAGESGSGVRGASKKAEDAFAPKRHNLLYRPGISRQRFAVETNAAKRHQNNSSHKKKKKKLIGAGDWMDSPWRASSPVLRIPGDESDEGSFSIGMSSTRLSPDGQRLVSGHWLSHFEVVGSTSFAETVTAFQLQTFSYMEKLARWVPEGEFTIPGDSAACPDCSSFLFSMEMARNSAVILQEGMGPRGADVKLSKAQVYLTNSFAKHNGWMTLGPPILSDSASHVIRKVAIADGATFVQESIVVASALGPLDEKSPGLVQIWTPETDQPDQDFEFPELKWVPVGSAIAGNNALFGFDVKLSRDGSILAVVGSQDMPTDDDPRNLACFIRMYQYSEDKSDWIQMGQDLTQEKDKYMILCPSVSLSGDGLTVVSGYRAYEKDCDMHPAPHGHVRAWSWDPNAESWSRKGPDLDAMFPEPGSPQDFFFGYDLRLSTDGNRLAISGMESTKLARVDDEISAYYIATFDWVDGNWKQAQGTLESGVFASFDMDDAGTSLAVGDTLLESQVSGLIQSYKYHPENAAYEEIERAQS